MRRDTHVRLSRSVEVGPAPSRTGPPPRIGEGVTPGWVDPTRALGQDDTGGGRNPKSQTSLFYFPTLIISRKRFPTERTLKNHRVPFVQNCIRSFFALILFGY